MMHLHLHPQQQQQQQEENSMSLWVKTQQLRSNPEIWRQVQGLYGMHFPLEVRHYFADWIEQKPWKAIDENDPNHEQYGHQLRDELIKMLEEKSRSIQGDDMFLIKLKLQETSLQFREMYGSNPLNLVRVVKNCLSTEERLVQQAENSMGPEEGTGNGQQDIQRQMAQQFELLQRCTQNTEDALIKLQHKQESFIIQYQESIKINNQLQQLANQPNGQVRAENEQRLRKNKQLVEKQLTEKAQQLLQLRLGLAEEHMQTVKTLTTLQNKVLNDELIQWKRRQQLAVNGAPFEGVLDLLQQWCETLAEVTWQNRQQIKKVELLRAQLPIDIPVGTVDHLPSLNTSITGLLSSLVTSTFIIEKQPPPVLKKDSRFTAMVRLLVGGKLNVHMNPPQVTATVISESQARSLLKSDKNIKKESSGEILNNTGTMEYHQATGQLSVTFRNMQLKRIKRADRKGTEAVTEEKFSILFQSSFTVGAGELVFQVWTLSLPVVVTVHGNQECNALATVLWDNAFAEPGRVPFHVPEKVPWPALAELLNCKFQSSMNGNQGLTPDALNYLAQKLYGSRGEDFSAHTVTWSQFNKETLPGRNHTFWEWFYSVLKLTREHLKDQWNDGSIIGFVSKNKAQEMLMSCPNGTFLLRFSDSEVGGITIAWVADDTTKPGERQVWNLSPFTAKDFSIRGLADRIKDLQNLIYLYRDIPKAQAFGKYWNTAEATRSAVEGYVGSDLVSIIIPPAAAAMDFNNPQSPQFPQSPQSTYDTTSMHGYDTNVEMDDLQQFHLTDYNPDDIEQINVNDLLANYGKPT